jgi:hypothetical protein
LKQEFIILEMPDYEFTKRYGLKKLPVIRCSRPSTRDKHLTDEDKEWNRENKREYKLGREYNELQQDLSYLLDDKIFIAETFCFMTSKFTGMKFQSARPELQYEEIDTGLPLSERIQNIKIRKNDASLAYNVDLQTLRMLNKALMIRNLSQPRDNPESDTPEILYRAFTHRCHSRHDKILGFRLSEEPLTSPCHHIGTLLDGSLVDKDTLRNQCEGKNPSDLIALSDSPLRIFNITGTWDFDLMNGNRIAVISVSKFLAMGVLFNRTTTLAESLDMDLRTQHRPTELQFANKNYWVACRWIPAECIEFYISISSLRKACKHHSFGVCVTKSSD